MNPFGTTRQDVGGANQYEPPRRRYWYDTVPFHPCRPPTPPWIIDWPLEVLSRGKAYMLQFSACRDVEELLQDARSGMVPGLVLPNVPLIDPGPTANTQGFTGSVNPQGNRIWIGRVRGSGFSGASPNRHIVVSPDYQGPAKITGISVTTALQAGGGAQPRDTWALGVGSAQNVVDVSAEDPAAALAGYNVIDANVTTDQLNEQIPQTRGYLPGAVNVPEEGGQNTFSIPLNIPIPDTTFKLWLAMQTYGVGASAVTIIVTLETQQGVSQRSGISGSVYNPPWTWGNTSLVG